MEPRPCGRGNPVAEALLEAAGELQWSHDLAVVETSWRPAAASCSSMLQWSHDLAVVETFSVIASSKPPWIRFNGAATLRSWKRGEGARVQNSGHGFNGATTLRSWKHGRRGETGKTVTGFNGATTLRSWKPNLLPLPLPRGGCFNGATTLRSWKQPTRRALRAPMIPLQWSHDLAVVETGRERYGIQAAADASMEPRPCGRGNPDLAHSLRVDEALQWSHDLAVVETAERLRAREHLIEASMEPRPCGRGNLRPIAVWARRVEASMEPRPCGRGNITDAINATTVGELQWSHDLAVVETCARAAQCRHGTSFNGATTLRSWKRRDHPRDDVREQAASMEPRPCGRGNFVRMRLPRFRGG